MNRQFVTKDDEIRQLRRQLTLSEKRIHELEYQLKLTNSSLLQQRKRTADYRKFKKEVRDTIRKISAKVELPPEIKEFGKPNKRKSAKHRTRFEWNNTRRDFLASRFIQRAREWYDDGTPEDAAILVEISQILSSMSFTTIDAVMKGTLESMYYDSDGSVVRPEGVKTLKDILELIKW